MPAVDDPFGIAASLPGQVAALARTVKDLSVNRTQSPAGLAIGATGLTVAGPTALSNVLSVLGLTTLTGGVTGPVAATGALSGASAAVTGAISGASLAVTGTIAGSSITGTSLAVGAGSIGGGAITGTSLTVGAGTLAAGAITGASLNLGAGGVGAGAITGTSLNATGGSITGGIITGTTIAGTAVAVGAGSISGGAITGSSVAGGVITGSSLNVSSGAIGGGAATVTSLNATGGAINGGTITGTAHNGGTFSGTSISVSGAAGVGGDINLTGDLYSPHGRSTPVTSGYVSAWLNTDGRLGATASTRASKRDLVPLTDLSGLLSLTPYLGRYVWDADDAPLKVFLIADEVQAAGFGPDVAPLDEDGEAFTVNYSQMVVPLLAAVQALTARLDAAGL